MQKSLPFLGNRDVPRSVRNALWCLVALVGSSGAGVLLAWLQRDEVIATWAQGNSSAQEILATGGMAALRDEAMVPKFVPLAVVSFIVFVVLVGVLGAFLVDGHGWSRLVLTATSFFGILVAVLGIDYDLPAPFVVISVLFLLSWVLLVVFLWHKDTSAHLRVH